MRYVCLILFSVLIATGCASSHKPNVYQSGQVQAPMRVRLATVIDTKIVEIEGRQTGVGASSGAAAGAVIGGRSGSRHGIIGGIAGAVVGGVAGTVVEKAASGKQGIEILYRLDGSDEIMALVQELDPENPIKAGDRVRITEGSFTARAIPLTGVLAATPPPQTTNLSPNSSSRISERDPK